LAGIDECLLDIDDFGLTRRTVTTAKKSKYGSTAALKANSR